jgi:hypothetical protein
VFGEGAGAALGRVAVECFGAVPREEGLMGIEVFIESSPVVPVFVEGIDQIGAGVAPKVKSTDILLYQAVWDVGDAVWVVEGISCCARATDEAHAVEWLRGVVVRDND